jgi:group I intron endonuclease
MKYGWENFTTEILHSNITLDEANTLEKQLIAECNTIVPNGYNLMSGGNNSLHSEETKQKMSASKRGKPRGSHSEETKIKLSEAAKHMNADTKAKLSAAKKGNNNPNFGKPGTMLGRKQTPESIAKRIAARKAKT